MKGASMSGGGSARAVVVCRAVGPSSYDLNVRPVGVLGIIWKNLRSVVS